MTQEQHNLVQQKIKNETTNFVRNQLHKNTKKPKGNVEMCKKYFLRKLCREIVLSHEYNFQFKNVKREEIYKILVNIDANKAYGIALGVVWA